MDINTVSLFIYFFYRHKHTHTHTSHTGRNCSYPPGCTTPVQQSVAFNDRGITAFQRCVVMWSGIILCLNSITGTLKGGRRCIWTLLWQILSWFWRRGNKCTTDTLIGALNLITRKNNITELGIVPNKQQITKLEIASAESGRCRWMKITPHHVSHFSVASCIAATAYNYVPSENALIKKGWVSKMFEGNEAIYVSFERHTVTHCRA